MRVLAVGDIHTKHWIIDRVEELLNNRPIKDPHNISPVYDKIVFCGDYADNWQTPWTASLETWYKLKKLKNKYKDRVELVLGNHDYSYVYPTSGNSGHEYLLQQLLHTPEHDKLRKWMEKLPIYITIDGVTYSHAGITEEWDGVETPESLWKDDSPLWKRPYETHTTYKNIPQVFGHTPSRTCHRITENIWCIDTFSQYRDGSPIGDQTVLRVTDGVSFEKVKL